MWRKGWIVVALALLLLAIGLVPRLSCIVEGVVIDTPLGPRAIEDVNVGDVVWSRNARGELVTSTVSTTAVGPYERSVPTGPSRHLGSRTSSPRSSATGRSWARATARSTRTRSAATFRASTASCPNTPSRSSSRLWIAAPVSGRERRRARCHCGARCRRRRRCSSPSGQRCVRSYRSRPRLTRRAGARGRISRG